MPLHEVQFNYRLSYYKYTLNTGCYIMNTILSTGCNIIETFYLQGVKLIKHFNYKVLYYLTFYL